MHNHLAERSLHLKCGYNDGGMNLIVCIAFCSEQIALIQFNWNCIGDGRCGIAWHGKQASILFSLHSHPVQYDWFIITSRWFHFQFQLKLQKYFHYYDLLMVQTTIQDCSHFNFSISLSLCISSNTNNHFCHFLLLFLLFIFS